MYVQEAQQEHQISDSGLTSAVLSTIQQTIIKFRGQEVEKFSY
jgi:hypothetical protein